MKPVGQRWWLLGAVVGLTFVIYVPTVRYGFVWDDNDLIKDNEFLARTNPVEVFTKSFWHNPVYTEVELSYYRPLVNLSYYFERQSWELNPAGYHLTNVILHCAIVFLTCLLLQRLFGSAGLAAAGGLFIGINPAVNCIVTFIANRTYLLAALMLLAALHLLMAGREASRTQNRGPRADARSRRRVLFFGLAFLGATLAMESGAMLGIIALGWLLLERRRYRHWWRWLLATVAVPLVYLFLRLVVARTPFPPSALRLVLEHPYRLINTFGHQSLMFFFPFGQKVSYAPGPRFDSFSVYTIAGLLFLLVPLALVIRGLVGSGSKQQGTGGPGPSRPSPDARPADDSLRPRLAALGYCWYVLFLLPFGQLFMMGPAGRMPYLAAPGILLLTCARLWPTVPEGVRQPVGSEPVQRKLTVRSSSVFRRAPARLAAMLFFSGYMVAFAVQTLRRNEIWKDETVLYQVTAAEVPDSPVGLVAAGNALQAAGNTEAAISRFRAAVEANSEYAPAREMLAKALMETGDFAGAIEQLRAMVRLEPNEPGPYSSMGISFAQVGMFDSAVAAFREAVRLNPAAAEAHNNLALALKQSGRIDEAILEYQAALRLEPGSVRTLNNLGSALMARGRTREALGMFREALRRRADFEPARTNIIRAFEDLGLPDSAAHYMR